MPTLHDWRDYYTRLVEAGVRCVSFEPTRDEIDEAINGANRSPRYALPRQVAWYVLRERHGVTNKTIQKFAGRDHSTVSSGIRRTGDLLRAGDDDTRDLLDAMLVVPLRRGEVVVRPTPEEYELLADAFRRLGVAAKRMQDAVSAVGEVAGIVAEVGVLLANNAQERSREERVRRGR